MNKALFALFCLLLSWWWWLSLERIGPVASLTGWTLTGCTLFLAAYQLRKWLSILPLGSAQQWMQLHVWISFMAAFIFFWHTGLRLPDGLFEWALYSCFAATWMSGCLGWIVTTTMPRRLARHGDVIIADEIPVIRRQLQLAADQLALDSVSDTGSTTLAEFYQRRLASFFGKQTHRWVHLTGSRRVHAWLDQEFAQIQRFMAEPEWKNLNQLRELAFAKINTDVQGAGTWLLRRWLFVHIPLTHALIVLIGFHIFWVYLFNAGSI